MNADPSEAGTLKSIHIEADVYDELRRICDRKGMRFKDFVDEALERAVYEDQSIDAMAGEIQDLKRQLSVYERSFMRGFRKGFWFAFLAMQGRLCLSADDEEVQLVKEKSPKVTAGSQLSLFS
jgi:hypothetical protein